MPYETRAAIAIGLFLVFAFPLVCAVTYRRIRAHVEAQTAALRARLARAAEDIEEQRTAIAADRAIIASHRLATATILERLREREVEAEVRALGTARMAEHVASAVRSVSDPGPTSERPAQPPPEPKRRRR